MKLLSPHFAKTNEPSIPIRLVEKSDLLETEQFDELTKNWIHSVGFKGKAGQIVTIPNYSGKLSLVLIGDPRQDNSPIQKYYLADILHKLPEGNYHLEGDFTLQEREEAALASLFAQYYFDRYSTSEGCSAKLALPENCDENRLITIAMGEFTMRNLINTPASDLGPKYLERYLGSIAEKSGATSYVSKGKNLKLEFPMIHAVGKAFGNPRLLDFQWGNKGPKLTLIGKGVCFDTGGLNIKPGNSMGIMKKDMGGAAVAIALAQMIIKLKIPLQLRVIIPAVENSISGNSMRPGDILTSRAGITVEITNTDAEGRLILADAIELAKEDDPDLMVTLATLTGAARIALGPEIVPFYTGCDKLAEIINRASERVNDPVWRLPLWQNYDSMLYSPFADCVNSPDSGFAGSITAALFLMKFVKQPKKWVHFDLYGWQNRKQPGYTLGGRGQVARALLESLSEVLPL